MTQAPFFMPRFPSWRSPLFRRLGLGISGLFLLGCMMLELTLGAAEIDLSTVWLALTAFDGSTNHLIITTVRLPRVLIAAVVGAALAVAGALMQGLTRNSLADPGILGISAGATFAVVITTFFLGTTSIQTYTWVAFAGGAIASVAVYTLGSVGRSGITPLKLILSGTVLAYLLSAFTTGTLILSQRTLDEIRFWLAGSVAGRDLGVLLPVLPYLLLGLFLAFGLGKQITALALGDEVAQGLGLQTAWVKAIAAIAVVLLAGGAVALAGQIGFIGLIIPHVVRFWVGLDYRWVLPYAALWGAILLSVADLAARLVIRPQELPVGIMTALIGGTFFIYLTRSKVR
ncbi:FecCD family ABC transporter permease [Leptolyngbya sp. O-77]|uniref:FecCD family ABC transporter permease n=1 Tax=Leptolyngbya sp. O-77 TaxID=1080068 RepID=UPI00074D41C3|nr:iron ABC transporter permease [Leptolyngbya sp. O-77]BAU40270.1 putative siderophore transport system permease protein YfiZ precursor [Leptolyngbya sp. O-77]